MSYVQIEQLKGIDDQTLKWDTVQFVFTTAQEIHDFLQENLAYVRAFRVQNLDGANILQYRINSPNSPLITVPINSEDGQTVWTSFIQVIPNAVTGSGLLEVDLVPMAIARKDGRSF